MWHERATHIGANAKSGKGNAQAIKPWPLSRSRVHPVLRLQQTIGNRAVQRLMIERGTVQRDDLVGRDVSTVLANPLIGLTRGDGIVFGTWEKRPRVRLLQQKLKEKASAGLKPDGMFGELTTKALNRFQLTRGILPGETVNSVTVQALMNGQEDSQPYHRQRQHRHRQNVSLPRKVFGFRFA